MTAVAAQSSPDAVLSVVLAAMVAEGCTDRQIAAAVRAALGDSATVAPDATVASPTVAKMRRLDADATVGAGGGKRPLAVLRAAIARDTRLPRSAARVGAAILDQYDPETGRCEIGTDRISGRCGLHRASVFRAIKALVGLGHFRRVPYGGMGHCNAYYPIFADAGATVGARDRRSSATQSQRDIYTTPSTPGESVSRKPRKPRGRGTDRLPGQRELLPPQPVPSGGAADEIATKKARERVHRDWNGQHNGRGHAPGIRPDPALWNDAVEAEKRERGAGIQLLNARILGEPVSHWKGKGDISPQLRDKLRPTGTGPP